jgi:hypothetical protein
LGVIGPVWRRRGAKKGPWIARGWREGRRGGLGCRAGGEIAVGYVDVSPVGGGDQPAVGASLSGIAGKGAACAVVLHGLPEGGPNGGVVSGGLVPERGKSGVIGGRKDEGLLGGDGEDGGVRGSDGVEQVDGGIANGVVAVDVEELNGRAVEAVEWHVVGVDCATTGTEDAARSADVGGRGKESKAYAERHRKNPRCAFLALPFLPSTLPHTFSAVATPS